MSKLKAISVVQAKSDCEDLKGWGVKKDQILYVIKECPPNPRTGIKVLLVREDNGTDDLELMPETAIYDNLVKPYKEAG